MRQRGGFWHFPWVLGTVGPMRPNFVPLGGGGVFEIWVGPLWTIGSVPFAGPHLEVKPRLANLLDDDHLLSHKQTRRTDVTTGLTADDSPTTPGYHRHGACTRGRKCPRLREKFRGANADHPVNRQPPTAPGRPPIGAGRRPPRPAIIIFRAPEFRCLVHARASAMPPLPSAAETKLKTEISPPNLSPEAAPPPPPPPWHCQAWPWEGGREGGRFAPTACQSFCNCQTLPTNRFSNHSSSASLATATERRRRGRRQGRREGRGGKNAELAATWRHTGHRSGAPGGGAGADL